MNSISDLKANRYDKEWQRYPRRIRRLLEWVVDMEYDGMTALLNSESFSVITSYAFLSRALIRGQWRGFTRVIDSDRYLLPERTEWLGVDALLQPQPIPDFPAIPESWTYAFKKALQEQIDAKRRSFEEILTSEVARLNGLQLRE